jgi:hypothetical protein
VVEVLGILLGGGLGGGIAAPTVVEVVGGADSGGTNVGGTDAVNVVNVVEAVDNIEVEALLLWTGTPLELPELDTDWLLSPRSLCCLCPPWKRSENVKPSITKY